MTAKIQPSEYQYDSANASHTESYLWAPVTRTLQSHFQKARVLDLGCGNGAFARNIARLGYDVVGIDPSKSGIEQAQSSSVACLFEVGSAYDNLLEKYGEFDCVVSLEVVEHLYSPKEFAKNVFRVLKPGGVGIISTPYHGYIKNLTLAVTGKLDAHFTALWDHGHIKFWSVSTLTQLLESQGLNIEGFQFAGRVRFLAKSMVAVVSKSVAIK